MRAHQLQKRRAHGLTLIEIMVSVTLTLVIMGTVMTIFSLITGAVSDNRARMDMVDREAAVCTRLLSDLKHRTVHTLPPRRPESAEGYLLYAEGVGTDRLPITERNKGRFGADPEIEDLARSKVLGDVDDVLMMTVQSIGAPFVGKGQGTLVLESPLAEVLWWVAPLETHTETRPLTLYRRVLLIVPQDRCPSDTGGDAAEFFQKYDVSAHYDKSTGKWVANTLADLTMPENRAFHQQAGQMHQVKIDRIKPFRLSGERYGEDVMMVNCVGFDIKVFDPRAAVTASPSGDVGLVPGDFGYPGGGPDFRGAYVDIGQESTSSGADFNRPMQDKSGMAGIEGTGVRGIYDTFSFHYEHDGNSQRGTRDGGTDLKDDGAGGGVDDAGERETSPPYTQALRGIEVKVRAYEPISRQVHETTVVGQFMPN